MGRVKQTIDKRGTHNERRIARRVSGKAEKSWPPEVLAAIGSFPDFPDLKTLRSGYGKDARRERLN
jgi:hypothetical protein